MHFHKHLVAMSMGKRNVTVWRLSVCPIIYSNLNRVHSTYSTWLDKGSMQLDQYTFPSEYYEDGHTCLIRKVSTRQEIQSDTHTTEVQKLDATILPWMQ